MNTAELIYLEAKDLPEAEAQLDQQGHELALLRGYLHSRYLCLKPPKPNAAAS